MKGASDSVVLAVATLLVLATLSLIPQRVMGGGSVPGFYGNRSLTPIPSQTLPSGGQVIQGAVPIPNNFDGVVRQNEEKAIIKWQTFNVGKEASVHFDQGGNADWAALNRISDNDPSQILGKLSADGTIYLLNRNGILFGPDSQINVQALIASSLNIKDEDFLNNRMAFKLDPEGQLPGVVSNHGTIRTGKAGSVFLLGPVVENSGIIEAKGGQVALVAGEDVEFASLEAESRLYPFVYVNNTGQYGTAVNYEQGQILAEAGLAGLYGRVVRQEGLIRCVTAISNNGRIELHASEGVVTGDDSRTITPITKDAERVHKSFQISDGEIHLGGLDEKVEIANAIRNRTTPTEVIEHGGEIISPSGTVTLEADSRVYLGQESSVDVVGLWVDKNAAAVSTQLNSVELKNDYGQADGVLQGETVDVNPYKGSAIGDISGALNFEFLTAAEMSTEGGTVTLRAPSGDIIMREGAEIDFSGGGSFNAGGIIETTRLLTASGQVYDIAKAPQWVAYERVLNEHNVLHERYGISRTFNGLYAGGAVPLKNYMHNHLQGDDAGMLFLEAKGIVLDGNVYGWATRGIFQTDTIVEEVTYDNFSVQTSSGTKQPRAGRLVIGVESPNPDGAQDLDYVTEDVVIAGSGSTLPDSFGPGDNLKDVQMDGQKPFESQLTDGEGPLYRTVLSAEMLNKARLSDLSINVNTKLTVEENVVLKFQSGGLRIDESIEYMSGMSLQYLYPDLPASFSVKAQALDHRGRVILPSGLVTVTIVDTVATPATNNPGDRAVQLNQRAYFTGGSSVSVAGERIDNTLSDIFTDLRLGQIDGGRIQVMDNTGFGAETILSPRAILDVSSGYVLKPEGEVSAGSAGSLELEGATLVVGADLRGYSLPNYSGGSISLHANRLTVQKEAAEFPQIESFNSELPADFQKGLTLGSDQLEDTGFTHIALKSFRDLTVENGAELEPSYVKMTVPGVGQRLNAVSPAPGFMFTGLEKEVGFAVVFPEQIGSSSISAKAGEPLYGKQSIDRLSDTYAVVVAAESSLEVAPGGTIVLSGLLVDLAGSLRAPAGDVILSAKGRFRDLTVRSTASILTQGVTVPERTPFAKGLPVGFYALDGGTVTLTAKDGNINAESGAVIDISGSRQARSFTAGPDNTITTISSAGAAGNLEVIYSGDLALDATLNADASMSTAHGGTLSISKQDDVSFGGLTIDVATIQEYLDIGFDAMTFRSFGALTFLGSINAILGRSLTLDAPVIKGSPDGDISFQAPWITLANTQSKYGDRNENISYSQLPAPSEGGQGSFTLSSDWMDIIGSIGVSGFNRVSLSAHRDITLTDQAYQSGSGGNMVAWKGRLRTPGDLVVRASRVYPTTLSNFTLKSDEGRITILPGTNPTNTPVHSAGGWLTVEAMEIDHQGHLAAPMGRLRFLLDGNTGDPSKRIQLGPHSVTSVVGDGNVLYGNLEDIHWHTYEKPKALTSRQEIQELRIKRMPESSIEIIGDEVITQGGAIIDISGGGTIFSYEFQPGTNGLVDPFQKEGRYIVAPGYVLPGEAVYLKGVAGLPAGTYSLLSEEYAFLPGAYVIEDLGVLGKVETRDTSDEGYPVTVGYTTIRDTDYRGNEPHEYSLRPAADVFKEGDFALAELSSGVPNRLIVQGTTTVLDGEIKANALADFSGGSITIVGAESAIVKATTSLPSGFSFDDAIPEGFQKKAIIMADGLSGVEVDKLKIGTVDITETVTFEEGAALQVRAVTLEAGHSITLEENSLIETSGPAGAVTLIAPQGLVAVEKKALVAVSDAVWISSEQLELEGEFRGDSSALNIVTDKLFIVDDTHEGSGPDGIYLYETLKGFTGFSHVTLTAKAALAFTGDVNLKVDKILALDVPEITGHDQVSLQSDSVSLVNTSDTTSITENTSFETGEMTVWCEDLIIGHGDITVYGFADVSLMADSDIAFAGDGSLLTDGALHLSAARMITSTYLEDDTDYEVPRFLVQAGSAEAGFEDVVMTMRGGESGDAVSPGGRLYIKGRSIELDTVMDISSGDIMLEAMGAAVEGNGITLKSKAKILAYGTEYGRAGQVSLFTEEGFIRIDSGACLNVSAGKQGDAGTISLYAPKSDVSLLGVMDGYRDNGSGGSLRIDGGVIEDLSGVLYRSADRGFNEVVDIRVRSGNITLSESDSIRALNVSLTADKGHIDISSRIDASGNEGGMIQLAAGGHVNIHGEGALEAWADGETQTGGEVFLNSVEGEISQAAGSFIDVSGRKNGQGGQVHFRIRRTNTNSQVPIALAGNILGASEVLVEGVQHYEETDGAITSTDINEYYEDAGAFMENADAIQAGLLDSGLSLTGSDDGVLQVVPGIEVSGSRNLVLGRDWDFTDWDFDPLVSGKVAGFLTLRAPGNLVLSGSLVDHPTSRDELNDLTELSRSWGMKLVAGADVNSADVMATHSGVGDFTIADQQIAYTENAALQFAAGKDAYIGRPPGPFIHKYMAHWYMSYSLATYSGDITGKVGGDLVVDDNGVIQSAIGDIDLEVGHDLFIGLDFSTGSAIRTTGTAPPNDKLAGLDWIYAETHDGGDINLNVGGSLLVREVPFYRGTSGRSTSHLRYWDNMYPESTYYTISSDQEGFIWSADYGSLFDQASTPTAGIATMGGGSVTVQTGRDLFCQIGTFKEGDLSVYTNGNLSGFFQVAGGKGAVTSSGSILSAAYDSFDTSLALFDSQVTVTAFGDVAFGTVFNPTFQKNVCEYHSQTPLSYLDYGETASVSLTSLTGELWLSGAFWKERLLQGIASNDDMARRVLPPTVNLQAKRDIYFGSKRGGDFLLAPSAVGNLHLEAGGTISGLYNDMLGTPRRATLRLSDLDPKGLYGMRMISWDILGDLRADETREVSHAATPIHDKDPVPSLVKAGGDIRELRLVTPEMTKLDAGGDITGLYFFGQNLKPTDVSTIRAEENIALSSITNPSIEDTGFIMSGPGQFLVQAGDSIDLGSTQGVQAVGNAFYSALSEEAGVMAVMAGITKEMSGDELSVFFEELREYGEEFSELLAGPSEAASAEQIVEEARTVLINPLLEDSTGLGGNIDMTSSNVSSSSEAGDVFVMATGDVNVGLTRLVDPSEAQSESNQAQRQETGIFTAKGGAINIFSVGDVNVNESRIMTFRGGNIVAWSDRGDINAGRGSKTAINAGNPRVVAIKDDEGNVISKRLEWEPPAVGSGIRTLTYDPDGALGPLTAPPAGDAYLFAPEGVIDAGEAGISAQNVILGATEVLNAENIEVAGVSVGVPLSTDGAGSLGGLAGVSNFSETDSLTEQVGEMEAQRERMTEQAEEMAESISMKWLKVEFVGFEEEEGRKEDDRRD